MNRDKEDLPLRNALYGRSDEWYLEMNKLMIGPRTGPDIRQLVDPYLNGESPDDFQKLNPSNEDAKRMLEELLPAVDALSEEPEGPPDDGKPTKDEEKRRIYFDRIKDRMWERLAVWLCFYYLGIPRPHLWEGLAFRGHKLGAYPRGGFYDKLAGDVYRFERKRLDKERQRTGASVRELFDGWEEQGIVVMAFTPTIVVGDDEDRALKGQYTTATDSRSHFQLALEMLAHRYLRLQQWLYIRKGYPIRYLFQTKSTIEATLRTSGTAGDDDTLRSASDKRVASFFAEVTDLQFLSAIKPDEMANGLTTCTLGQEHGVLANRPYMLNSPARLCSWIGDDLLRAERGKINEVFEQDEVAAHPALINYQRLSASYAGKKWSYSAKWWPK